jgi:prephenate dehydrogenase
VRRLAIVGLGLLGGSVGLAARARGLAREVVGVGRSAESQLAAQRAGAVDGVVSGSDALRGADLVVVATPVSAMAPTLARLAPALAPGALVTDVGSVKGPLADVLPGLLPAGVAYVGAHPMAGSHQRGAQHARADLFEGAACVVTPTRDTDPAALAKVEAFWRALGCRVVRRDPEAHDAEVAWVSHAPHVLAFAFARALAGGPDAAREIAGPGFRDFTRIAKSDAELWSEILAANRKAIAGPLHETLRRLRELAEILERGQEAELEKFIASARAALVAEPREE